MLLPARQIPEMYLSRGGQLQEAEVELTATASVTPQPCSHGRALQQYLAVCNT